MREKIDLTVIVFNDGYLNQIRMQQLSDTGREYGVTLPAIDFQALAAAVGAEHVLCEPGNLAALARRRTGSRRDAYRGAGERQPLDRRRRGPQPREELRAAGVGRALRRAAAAIAEASLWRWAVK